MLDDPINIAFEPPDPDVVCANNLETCRQSGVMRVSREHADGLMAEWTASIPAGLSVPTQH